MSGQGWIGLDFNKRGGFGILVAALAAILVLPLVVILLLTPEAKACEVPGGDAGVFDPNSIPEGGLMVDPNLWKLTLPLPGDDGPLEIRGGALTKYSHPIYYARTATGAIAFRANAGGYTTENSSYPRSELRELIGGKEADWSNSTGTHTMTITESINYTLKAKPEVSAGQIHDAEDDVLRILLRKNQLYASFTKFTEDRGGGKHPDGEQIMLDPAYKLGQVFTVQIVASPAGVDVLYNGAKKAHVDGTFNGGYFKAGSYVQSNTDKGDAEDAYGEVVIHALSVTHDGAAPNATNPGDGSVDGEGDVACTCQTEATPSLTLTDPAIQQASGMAASRRHPGIVYIINDDPAPILAVDTNSGKVVGRTTLPDGLVDDTESLSVDGQGRLWIGNLGNNHGNSAGLSVVSIDEPGTTTGPAKNVHRYRVDYPGAAPNVEAMAVHPSTGEVSLISKNEKGPGTRYVLPETLSESGTNRATVVDTPAGLPSTVTDASYTEDGAELLVRSYALSVVVYNTTTWKQARTIDIPATEKGETLTVAGDVVLTGSEGKNSPLNKTPLDGATGTDSGGECEGGDEGGDLPAFSGKPWDGGPCVPTASGAPIDCAHALQRAAELVENAHCSAAWAHERDPAIEGGNWDNRCGEIVAYVYGYSSSGEHTALDHYRALKAAGDIGEGEPPPGALVFFTSSQPAGHVAIYAGGAKAYSNDYIQDGCYDLTPMSAFTHGGKYLGWGYPNFPKGGRL